MYYFFRMYGLFQTTFYFGYMALFSMALGIMCGKFLYIYFRPLLKIYINLNYTNSMDLIQSKLN